MAISVSKKKSRLSKRVQSKEFCFFYPFLARALFRVPAVIVLLILIYLWSSSTTIISGTQPDFKIPIPLINGSSTSITGTEENENATLVNSVLRSSLSTIDKSSKEGRNEELETSAPNGVPSIVLETSIPIVNNSSDKDGNVELANSDSIERKQNVKEAENLSPTAYKISSKLKNETLAIAYVHVEEQLRVHRSWISSAQNHANCKGRGVYVYELPTKFNEDLVAQCNDMIPWVNFCTYFNNDALGVPIDKLGRGWYQTHQYSLEPIFHSRVLKHPCRVYNQNEAKLFYVPYYGGLDILRWHFKNVSEDVKDSLAFELVRWLETQKPWFQNSGTDHVFVLGKISWDFRRLSKSSWGSRFLEIDEMQNPIKLLIERQPWQVNDIGIPHPTYFHPHTDDDIITWQQKVISSNRRSLVSFAGAARPNDPESVRSLLIEQCLSTTNQECRFLNCSSGACAQPESLIELFMESEFCLQPPGDSPTRKSVFDSLVSGCIPVLFDPFTAYYQYPWHLPEDHEKYSVFIDQDEVRSMNVNISPRLVQIPLETRENMRRYIVYELLPGLVYGDPNSQLEKFQDGFSITMNNLIERVNRLQ